MSSSPGKLTNENIPTSHETPVDGVVIDFL